jgi:hypothetical protein
MEMAEHRRRVCGGATPAKAVDVDETERSASGSDDLRLVKIAVDRDILARPFDPDRVGQRHETSAFPGEHGSQELEDPRDRVHGCGRTPPICRLGKDVDHGGDVPCHRQRDTVISQEPAQVGPWHRLKGHDTEVGVITDAVRDRHVFGEQTMTIMQALSAMRPNHLEKQRSRPGVHLDNSAATGAIGAQSAATHLLMMPESGEESADGLAVDGRTESGQVRVVGHHPHRDR